MRTRTPSTDSVKNARAPRRPLATPKPQINLQKPPRPVKIDSGVRQKSPTGSTQGASPQQKPFRTLLVDVTNIQNLETRLLPNSTVLVYGHVDIPIKLFNQIDTHQVIVILTNSVITENAELANLTLIDIDTLTADIIFTVKSSRRC